MRYFQVVGDSTDQIAKTILKDYQGRAYIIKLVKEMKEEPGPKKWYHLMGLKPPKVSRFYYRAYCSLPEDHEDMDVIEELRSEPAKKAKKSSLEGQKELSLPKKEDILELSDNGRKTSENSLNHKLEEDMQRLREVIAGLYENASKPKKEELFLPYLLDKGFSYEFSKNFLDTLQTDVEDKNILKLILKEKLRMRLSLKEDFLFEEGTNYLFLGPTGVGKTTTLAKMAALCYKQGKRQFRFVSFDSYRLGADEQLKKFANIFEQPFSLIQTEDEMKKLVKNKKPSEILFLDTAGESIKKEIKISEVLNYLTYLKEPTVIFLVVSVHSKMEDLLSIYNQFERFKINYYIITKLDESSKMGNILEFLSQKTESVLFYTDGQAVPDDIKQVSLERFFEYI